jgi:RNA polymerase sigma-70 factor (ECF subfamily)
LSVTFVKRHEIAEEIVQDVFIKLWKSRTSLVINISLRAYLFKMVQNLSLNYIRDHSTKKSIHEQSFEDTDIQLDTYSKGLTEPISEKLFSDEIELDFFNALNLLPDQCREVFSLCRFEGLTYSEIAIKLNVSVSTIKTQMGRAMDKLHESLKRHLV